MLKQTLYCSGNITDSQNICKGLIRADPVGLADDSRSEKPFSSQVFSIIKKKKKRRENVLSVLHRE